MKNELKMIEKLDWLIRLEATGNIGQLCKKLNISKAELCKTVEKMKQFNLQVIYSIKLQSYIYEEHNCFSYQSVNQILYKNRRGRKRVLQNIKGVDNNLNYKHSFLKIV